MVCIFTHERKECQRIDNTIMLPIVVIQVLESNLSNISDDVIV